MSTLLTRFHLQLRSEYGLFPSSDDSRLFVGVQVVDTAHRLSRLVQAVNNALESFQQPKYFSIPQFHVSVASFLPRKAEVETGAPPMASGGAEEVVDTSTNVIIPMVSATASSDSETIAKKYGLFQLSAKDTSGEGDGSSDSNSDDDFDDSTEDNIVTTILPVDFVVVSIGYRLFRISLKDVGRQLPASARSTGGDDHIQEITARAKKSKVV
jgi:hypothetical protein